MDHSSAAQVRLATINGAGNNILGSGSSASGHSDKYLYRVSYLSS